MPNLLAEMLHPASHWSLALDNDVPAPAAPTAHGSPTAPAEARHCRSSELEDIEQSLLGPNVTGAIHAEQSDLPRDDSALSI